MYQERDFEAHIGFSGLVHAVIRAAASGARQQQAHWTENTTGSETGQLCCSFLNSLLYISP